MLKTHLIGPLISDDGDRMTDIFLLSIVCTPLGGSAFGGAARFENKDFRPQSSYLDNSIIHIMSHKEGTGTKTGPNDVRKY